MGLGRSKPADYQTEFIELCLEKGVLKFGSFTLKSGRTSPYFFNAGLFNTGKALNRLGQYYAKAIKASGIEYDVIFGPAYKGIPLAAAVSIAMDSLYGEDIPYAFDRKEAKDHGEGGVIVGSSLKDKRVLIIDDVITAGTAVREAMSTIRANGGTVVGVCIALDRQEKGTDSEVSAVQQVQQDFGFPVVSIANLAKLLDFLRGSGHADLSQQALEPMEKYQAEYGVRA